MFSIAMEQNQTLPDDQLFSSQEEKEIISDYMASTVCCLSYLSSLAASLPLKMNQRLGMVKQST